MLENHKFDTVALGETWLKDNKHQYEYDCNWTRTQNHLVLKRTLNHLAKQYNQYEYVQIPGYNTVFRNRENKKGGGVGFYVKDHLSFTLPNDITKMDDSIETIWIEICRKNKNSAFLISAFYQPGSDKKKK